MSQDEIISYQKLSEGDFILLNTTTLKKIPSKRPPLKLKIKYKSPETKRLMKIDQGDWIDLYADEDVTLLKGNFKLISLGVAMELPEGYEANIVPRGSTFKNWGILQTNHFGVVDESYCGDNDFWFYPAYATRDTIIAQGDKICQFRINKKMEAISFVEVEHLDNRDRGGHGTTGTK